MTPECEPLSLRALSGGKGRRCDSTAEGPRDRGRDRPALTKDGDIEATSVEEVRLDIESVLKEYLRQERQVVDEAKSRDGGPRPSLPELGKTKSAVAREKRCRIGEDMLHYLLEQVLTMLFHSAHVEEVFAEDNVLRKKMTSILRRHMEVEGELDKEVRSKSRTSKRAPRASRSSTSASRRPQAQEAPHVEG